MDGQLLDQTVELISYLIANAITKAGGAGYPMLRHFGLRLGYGCLASWTWTGKKTISPQECTMIF